MLYTVAVVMVLLWLLGMVSNYTMNGFVHVLLVVAIIIVLVRVIGSRRAI
ncbi:MAG: lmo0937 family membrane protein [Planctomycetes bacterium]|nr:lmo0937 family membrane protein [Planctomycetota bacterium]